MLHNSNQLNSKDSICNDSGRKIIIIFRLGIYIFIYAYTLDTSTLWSYSVDRHVGCEVCAMNYSIRHK